MLARLLALVVRLLAWTWRVQREPWPLAGPCVVAFWHGEQLPLVALHRAQGLTGMVSLSRDGERLSRVLRALGYPVLRGSSSRGGAQVLVAALRLLRGGGRPAIAVDGPRGPAGQVQPGAEALAARAGLPVVWGKVDASPAWRARSWDRFCLPLPFARVRLRYGVWRPGEGRLAEAMPPP